MKASKAFYGLLVLILSTGYSSCPTPSTKSLACEPLRLAHLQFVAADKSFIPRSHNDIDLVRYAYASCRLTNEWRAASESCQKAGQTIFQELSKDSVWQLRSDYEPVLCCNQNWGDG